MRREQRGKRALILPSCGPQCSLNRSEDRLASVSDDGVLSVWDVGSGDEVVNLPVFPAALAPRPLHCNPVVWLESGLSLAVGTREGVQVVSPATPLECGPPPRV
jgi:WD40 repeat protein